LLKKTYFIYFFVCTIMHNGKIRAKYAQ